MNTAKLKAAAEKAKDDFRPNVVVSTRDVLELIAALEAAQNLNAELDERLLRYAGIATQRAEHVARLEKRVAELEARIVRLPQGYVIRAGHPINEGERHVMVPKDGGDWLSVFDVEHALRAAGINLETGGEA